MTIGLVNAGGTPSTTTFYRGDGQWAVPAGTGVTSVTGTLPIQSSGGNTPVISIDTMTAATAGAGGLKGAVPASAAGDEAKFLRGDATWATPTDLKGVETITVTAPITGGGTATSVGIGHKAVLTDNSGNAGTYTSANVTVDGDGHITGITNGHGSNGGVFTGSKAYSNATDAGLFLSLIHI